MNDRLPKVADELFTLPPKEFIKRRNEIAKQLKQSGDKEGSSRVAALAKPSLAAWALNQVARWNSRMVHELTRIDETLRKPESGAKFRKASAERHRIVGQIVQAASEVLENSGHSAGAGVIQKITQTLLAIGNDEEARQALVEGRLSTDLEPGGPGGDMWSVDIPEAAEKPPPQDEDEPTAVSEPEPEGGPRQEPEDARREPARAEIERLRRRLAGELEGLMQAAEERRRIARQARDEAKRARLEAERAEAAAALAEQEEAEAAADLERKKQELAELDG